MSGSEVIRFKNCRILRNHQILVDDLWVRNGRIIDPEKVFFDDKYLADKEIDCKNALIAPGFIDLQINGGYGVDFSSEVTNVEEGVSKVAKELLAHGVTSFCPTIVTSPPGTYKNILPKIIRRKGDENGATILGVHLEGPFISPEKKGAHPLKCIRDLENGFETLLETYGSLDNVQIVTLAPEKKNVSEVIRCLREKRITISLGHSMANLCDGELAVKNGASLITHLFNAMLPFHHRDPGLVGLLASDEIPLDKTVYYGIIADGVHTHPAALRIAHRTHPEGLILVTDAIAALGLEEGRHNIGQLDLEVRDAKAYIAGTDTLSGSIAQMDDCIRTFQIATSCSIVCALEAASLHPAKCLGIDNEKGSLTFGADADFVLISEDFTVRSTWIAGQCVYVKDSDLRGSE